MVSYALKAVSMLLKFLIYKTYSNFFEPCIDII